MLTGFPLLVFRTVIRRDDLPNSGRRDVDGEQAGWALPVVPDEQDLGAIRRAVERRCR